jgi:hypothetical protein
MALKRTGRVRAVAKGVGVPLGNVTQGGMLKGVRGNKRAGANAFGGLMGGIADAMKLRNQMLGKQLGSKKLGAQAGNQMSNARVAQRGPRKGAVVGGGGG